MDFFDKIQVSLRYRTGKKDFNFDDLDKKLCFKYLKTINICLH